MKCEKKTKWWPRWEIRWFYWSNGPRQMEYYTIPSEWNHFMWNIHMNIQYPKPTQTSRHQHSYDSRVCVTDQYSFNKNRDSDTHLSSTLRLQLVLVLKCSRCILLEFHLFTTFHFSDQFQRCWIYCFDDILCFLIMHIAHTQAQLYKFMFLPNE